MVCLLDKTSLQEIFKKKLLFKTRKELENRKKNLFNNFSTYFI